MILSNVIISALICAVVSVENNRPYRDVHATKVDSVEDQTCDLTFLDSSLAASKFACTSKCGNSKECLFFFYNKKSKTCQIYGRSMDMPDCFPKAALGSTGYRLNKKMIGEPCAISEECVGRFAECGVAGKCACQSGSVYHQSKKTCEQDMAQQNCSNSNECLVAHSECSEGRCRCQRGYRFLSGNQSCETDCVKYGNTFQVFRSSSTSKNDVAIFSDKSANECAQLCIDATGYTCRSFDVSSYSGKCYHQEVYADISPLSYVDHYDRNCA